MPMHIIMAEAASAAEEVMLDQASTMTEQPFQAMRAG